MPVHSIFTSSGSKGDNVESERDSFSTRDPEDPPYRTFAKVTFFFFLDINPLVYHLGKLFSF